MSLIGRFRKELVETLEVLSPWLYMLTSFSQSIKRQHRSPLLDAIGYINSTLIQLSGAKLQG